MSFFVKKTIFLQFLSRKAYYCTKRNPNTMKPYLFFCLFLFAHWANAQAKLYAVLLADTQNPQTGKAHAQNLRTIRQEIDQVAKNTQLRTQIFVLDSTNFSRNALENLLANLTCQKNDVIFFYYSGSEYVGRAAGEDVKLWFSDDILPLNQLKSTLDSLKPRLSIVITDVCNQADSLIQTKASSSQADKNNYVALFMKSSGKISLSNHFSRDQADVKTGQNGSIFTAGIIEAIREQPDTTTTSYWEDIYKKSKYFTVIESRGSQNPQSEMGVTNTNWVEEKPRPEPKKDPKIRLNPEFGTTKIKEKPTPQPENQVAIKTSTETVSEQMDSESLAKLDALQAQISIVLGGNAKNLPAKSLQQNVLKMLLNGYEDLRLVDGFSSKKSKEFLGTMYQSTPFQITQIRWLRPAQLMDFKSLTDGSYRLFVKVYQQYRYLDKDKTLKYSSLSEKIAEIDLLNPSGEAHDWQLKITSVKLLKK